MTVSSDDSRDRYEGNDSATTFDFNFYILADSDLKVVHTDSAGTPTELVLDTDYSVTGAGDEDGGSITYPLSGSPLTAGEYITLSRDMTIAQPTDLRAQRSYNPSVIEKALDRIVMFIQQLNEKLGRALVFPVSEDRTGKSNEVPSPSDGKVLGWSSGELTNISLGTVEYDLSISGGDAAKPVGITSGEDGIEVISALPANFVDKQAMQDDSVGLNEFDDSEVYASTAEAEAGSSEVKVMTPKRVKEWYQKYHQNNYAATPTQVPLDSETISTKQTYISFPSVFGDNSSYYAFIVKGKGLSYASGLAGILSLQMTDDDGSTYETGYEWFVSKMTSSQTAGSFDDDSSGSSYIRLADYAASSDTADISIVVFATSDGISIFGTSVWNGSSISVWRIAGSKGSVSPATGFRLLVDNSPTDADFDAGTVSVSGISELPLII